MPDPTLNDFPPGARFEVTADGVSLGLSVDAAQELAGAVREGGGFRVEFIGPAKPVLAQATYRFAGAGVAAMDIFIVPVGGDEAGARYEAVFF